MLYLSHHDISTLGADWRALIQAIRSACIALYDGDFCQPIKPYITFDNSPNRIIAMPAYLGGDAGCAGIKWIASFPGNLDRGLARAQSVTILNNCETGVAECIINTSLISAIRTAAVTGLVIEEFLQARPQLGELKIGLSGFGVVGRMHISLLAAICPEVVGGISVFDPRGVDVRQVDDRLGDKIAPAKSWQEAFADCDIYITATTSREGYIDGPAKPGSLHLNISLRDYKPDFRHKVDHVLVDNWDEVCRQNTDVEKMHRAGLLNKEDTLGLPELIRQQQFKGMGKSDTIMFNPMGMAVFDMATALHFRNAAMASGTGTELKD